MRTDCIVVGGGVIGLMTARELARAGLRVTVMDRREAGREASWAGGGILSPLYPWRESDAVIVLARWGQVRYRTLAEELREESGIDPEWTPSGMLILDGEDTQAAKAWGRKWDRTVETLSRERILREWSPIGAVEESAVWMPETAQIRPPRLMKALKESLRRSGAFFLESREVQGFLMDNDRVRGVVTAEERLPAERVLVAAGAWSGELLRRIGVTVPVEPVRGQMIQFRGPAAGLNRMILKNSRYLIPRRDGTVVAGSTVESVGFDPRVTEEGTEAIARSAYQLWPPLRDSEVLQRWAGLRPGSPTGVPVMGPHPQRDGLFVAVGHFRNGITLGPASARLMADLLLERTPEIDPEPYRIPIDLMDGK